MPGAWWDLQGSSNFMSKIEYKDLMMGMRLFSTKLVNNGKNYIIVI